MPEESIEKKAALPAAVFRNILLDFGLANIYSALNSGVFLTGYLLFLGANNVQIGLITSLPLLANISAPVFSFFIDRSKERKKLCLKSLLPARLLWFFLAALPLLLFYQKVAYPLVIFTVIYLVITVLYVFASSAWLPWMGDLIPAETRGYYFGRRIIAGGLAALIFTVAGGQYLDYFKLNPHIGFSSMFFFSAVFGVFSFIFMSRIPDAQNTSTSVESFTLTSIPKKMLKISKDSNFMKLVFFNTSLSFAITLLSTYLNVYMLKELKMSYTLITSFAIVNMVMNLALTGFWAKIIDKYGCKPVILICLRFIGIIPFFWCLTGWSYWIILPLNTIGGIAWSGFNLAQFNIMLKLTPSNERASYMGFNTMLVSLVSFIAPLIGGFLLDSMKDLKFNVLFLSVGSFQVMFVISGLLRSLPMRYLKILVEPKEMKEEEVFRVIRTSIVPGFMEGLETIMSYMFLPIKKIEHYVGRFIERDRKRKKN